MEIFSNLDFKNASRITNLPAPSAANDAARLADINAAVEGLKQKDPCVVATQGNLNLSAPGASIDGVSLSTGDRVLVKVQTTTSQNGIYVWNGAASAMTRAADASTGTEITGALTEVTGGTNSGQWWRQTATVATIDSSAVTWSGFGLAPGQATTTSAGIAELATQGETDAGTDDTTIVTPLKLNNWSGKHKKGTLTFGDGSSTQFNITHNFGTRDLQVQVYRNASPWDNIECDISRPDINTVQLNFAVAPTSDQLIGVVIA